MTGEAEADTFGTGANTFAIEFTTIGNPGNAADTAGAPNPVGAVGYEYRIGTYEVSQEMITKANAEAGLGITFSDMTTFGGNGPDKPATGISWNEAARFANYLNVSSGFSEAYKFTLQPDEIGYDANANVSLWEPGDLGYDPANPFRNRNAYYVLPSLDEWYKAAYYDPVSETYFTYPTGSNTLPFATTGGTSPGSAVYNQTFATGPSTIDSAGGLSPYGTMAQGGNVFEWEESAFSGAADPADSRGVRGGSWGSTPILDSVALQSSIRPSELPSTESDVIGFRIASVPEPSTTLLLLAGSAACLLRRRRHPVNSHQEQNRNS